MATFTQEELQLAVEIHQTVKTLNARILDAERLGLDVALRLEEQEETFEPGSIHHLHEGVCPYLPLLRADAGLRVLVFKAIAVEAANADSEEEPDAVLPHEWMG